MSLYNKYRPERFSDLVGATQKAASKAIVSRVDSGDIPDYMFISGPSGTGKTTLARIFAAYVNCECRDYFEPEVAQYLDKPNLDVPCGACYGCKQIFEEEAYTLVDGSFDTSVANVREVVSRIALPNLSLQHNVILFDEMHNLSPQSQDALLKCCENPPLNTTVICCTTDPHKVKTALRTRGLPFSLTMPTKAEVIELLHEIAEPENFSITKTALDTAIGPFETVREAVSKLEVLIGGGDPSGLSEEPNEKDPVIQIAACLASSRYPGSESLSELLKEARKDPKAARATILEYLHSVLLKKLRGGTSQRTDITRLLNVIGVLGQHTTEDLPVFLTTDIMKAMKGTK